MRCVAAVLALVLATPTAAQNLTQATKGVVSARLTQPTDRYSHGVFGDPLEWGALEIITDTDACPDCAVLRRIGFTITLPETRVFEDVAPRLADLDGDGLAEVIVVETDLALGASLAIYDARGKRAATAFIGQTHRWLAPAGVGDFDGDGRVELAYIDRPHLARELVFLRYESGRLSEIARAAGFTNHRFGDPAISGGTRSCNGADSLILASADWSRLLSISLNGAAPVTTDLGPLSTPQDLTEAMSCP